MTSLHLRGFALPGFSLPSFVIPYFGDRNSNQLYAQELNDEHRIAAFLAFDPDHFQSYVGPIPVHEAAVGDYGLMAYVDAAGRLTSGEPRDVRRSLAEFRFSSDGTDAFFATEAMELRGDQPGLEHAIEIAARRFTNVQNGLRWKAREVAVRWGEAKTNSGTVSQLQLAVRELRSLLNSPSWFRQFRSAWDQFGPDSVLVEIALQWLQNGGIDSKGAGGLFVLLLPGKRQVARLRAMPAELPRLAYDWLSNMRYAGKHWVAVWRRLHQIDYFPEGDIVEVGLRYLRAFPHDSENYSYRSIETSWLTLWTLLWENDVCREDLVYLIQSRSEIATRTEFAKIMLVLLAEADLESWARSQLDFWLSEATHKNSNLWVKVCLEVLYESRGDASTISRAVEWLKTDGVNVHSWYELWKNLRPFVELGRLIDLAHEWLRQGLVTMRIWPEILVDLIDMHQLEPDGTIISYAAQWLDLSKDFQRRDVIENIVASGRWIGPSHAANHQVYLSFRADSNESQVRSIIEKIRGLPRTRLLTSANSATREALERAGHASVENFVDSQLRNASLVIVLFGNEPSVGEWVNFEVTKSHQLGRKIIAIDVGNSNATESDDSRLEQNPLAQWQVDIDGQNTPFFDIYPTYKWTDEVGVDNLLEWLDAAVRNE